MKPAFVTHAQSCCIICSEILGAAQAIISSEHIFPESIGGRLTINRVCKPCNDWLGAKIDTTISEYFPVISKRERYRIAGKNKTVPNTLLMLMGQGVLVDDPTQKVKLSFNAQNGKPELHLLPRIVRTQLNGSTTAINISFDARDRQQASDIVRRTAQRAGKTLSDTEIASILSTGVERVVDSPIIKSSPSIALTDYRLGLLKIAYELSWRWLGDTWLSDPVAEQMRRALAETNPGIDMDVRGQVGSRQELEFFSLLKVPADCHWALGTAFGDQAVILLSIFDVLAASFVISENANRFNEHASLRKGFVIQHDVSGTVREWDYHGGILNFGNWEIRNSESECKRLRSQMARLFPARILLSSPTRPFMK